MTRTPGTSLREVAPKGVRRSRHCERSEAICTCYDPRLDAMAIARFMCRLLPHFRFAQVPRNDGRLLDTKVLANLSLARTRGRLLNQRFIPLSKKGAA